MPILRVAFARVLRDENAPVSLFEADDFRESLLQALNPAVSVERYSRSWRLSQPITEDEWVTGRLGFVEPTVTPGITYSEEDQDFVELEEHHEGGSYSNFAIHIPSQYIVFEIKTQEIRLQSFFGAFKAILEKDQLSRLTAELVFDSAKLNEWLDSVDKVSSIKISLRRPNPDYTGRPEAIRRILEETNASKVKIEAESEEDGLEVQNSELREYADSPKKGMVLSVRLVIKEKVNPISHPVAMFLKIRSAPKKMKIVILSLPNSSGPDRTSSIATGRDNGYLPEDHAAEVESASLRGYSDSCCGGSALVSCSESFHSF